MTFDYLCRINLYLLLEKLSENLKVRSPEKLISYRTCKTSIPLCVRSTYYQDFRDTNDSNCRTTLRGSYEPRGAAQFINLTLKLREALAPDESRAVRCACIARTSHANTGTGNISCAPNSQSRRTYTMFE